MKMYYLCTYRNIALLNIFRNNRQFTRDFRRTNELHFFNS